MRPITEATLNIQDVPKLFSKYGFSIFVSTVVMTALFFAISFQVPKKYKTHFVLTIYSKYFQSPLIGDFVPELSESGNEMMSQRESLIRQVLTPEYLDELGTRYGIYSSSKKNPTPSSFMTRLMALDEGLGFSQPGSKDSELSEERESLRSRIEIFSQNNTTFKVGFVRSEEHTSE